MISEVPTAVLNLARRKANLSQTQLASALNVAASVVSRLEKSENADPKMAARYLSAIDSELSRDISAFYSQRWTQIERPPFLHPERGQLRAAEEAMQALGVFEGSAEFDPILQEPLQRLRARLLSETSFIRQTEHGIAFIGDIGVGKTTALSFVTNLLVPDRSGKMGSVFPTGSGRTTVCEVAIKIAPTFGIAVDCLAEEEIRALVSELVGGMKSGKSGVSSEVERVIRNMSDLRRSPARVRVGGERSSGLDPLKEMVDKTEAHDELVAEVISRMELAGRTETQMILSESAEGSMEWLATNIANINYGTHPNFSIPQRITVLLPLTVLRDAPYRLKVIDTKGVEGTTQRPDLKAQLDDPRTLTVLCSKFADAPGTTPLSIVREIVESGSDAVSSGRLCLLVLPREDEAMKIVDDSGSNPLDAEEGCAIRQSQIQQQFATEGLPNLPVNFYNVGTGPAEEIWNWLLSKISQIRAEKAARIARTVAAAHDLIANSDVAKSRQARSSIATEMTAAVQRFNDLPIARRPAYFNLVEQAKKAHQSSIAASVNRRGKWEQFQVAHILGVGVRADANLRTRDTFVRLDENIQGLKSKYAHLNDIKDFLESLEDDLATWKQEFLSRTALVGRVLYAPHLDSADALWTDCSRRYGAGSGYRVDVSDIFRVHFEESEEAQAAATKVESAVQRAWEEIVITPLSAATKQLDYENEA